jgi:hypothetical protein
MSEIPNIGCGRHMSYSTVCKIMSSLAWMSHGEGNKPLAVDTIPALTAHRWDGMIKIMI